VRQGGCANAGGGRGTARRSLHEHKRAGRGAVEEEAGDVEAVGESEDAVEAEADVVNAGEGGDAGEVDVAVAGGTPAPQTCAQ
jgi:hypothetical protein